MESEKELSLHVLFNKQKRILISKRSNFLSAVCSKFNINKDNIEIYEMDKNKSSLKKIDVADLNDFSHVELKEKQSISTDQVNGHRQANTRSMPSTSIVAAMCSKLQENKNLTASESRLLISHLQSLPAYLKRRLDSGNTEPIEMKNRKIQANPIDQKVVYTQTDKLIELSKASSSSTGTNVQQEIKRYAKKEKRDPDTMKELMTKTYQDRRNLIMIQKPMVLSVRESYPLLFNIAEVRNELERILYIGKCDEFLSNIEKYADIILHMTNDKDPLMKTITEKVKSYSTTAQKKYCLEVGSILMLSNLIGEQRSFLKLRDTSQTQDPGDHPYIVGDAKLHDLFSDQYSFKIYTEKVFLCEVSDFKEAILALIASFFIFNISYPDSTFNTMVMIEKLYLEANDTEDFDIDDNVRQIVKQIQFKHKARARER